MRTPLSLKIETTNICNSNCVFCPYKNITRQQGIMSQELFQKAVTEYINLGGKSIHLCPIVGDVLVDDDFLNKLRCAAALKPKRLYFWSNLIALNKWSDDEVREMLSLASLVCVSLGPNRETHKFLFGVDKFETVLKNLKRLYTLNDSTRILARGRSEEGVEIDPRLINIIGDVPWLTKYWNWGGAIDNPCLTYQSPTNQTVTCPYHSLQLPVFWDGKVGIFPCFDYDAKFVIGDLNKDNLEDILKSKEYMDFIRLTKRNKHDNPYCKRCND